MYDTYLAHHGILGQKWGIRRYQNEDGSLTDAGKKRYANVNENAARELVRQRKDDLRKSYGYDEFKKAQIKLNNARSAVKYAKERDALLNETGEKSARRLKYEQQYKDKGYSDEEAAIAARNKERTRKILIGVGATALAAAAAYGAYKYHDYVTDTVLDNKTNLYRYAIRENGLHDNFYATPDLRDAKKYIGLYGAQQWIAGTGQQKTIRLKNAVRVASEKSARQALNDVVEKDPTFKNAMVDTFKRRRGLYDKAGITGPHVDMYDQAIRDVKSGNMSRTVYDAMNRCLNDRSTDTSQRFINALKERGYGAVVDINDKRYSGYNANRPLIIFDASNANIRKLRDIGMAEINAEETAARNQLLGQAAMKVNVARIIATGGMAATTAAAYRSSERRAIRRYRKQHPSTNMNDAEILDALRIKN